MSRPLKERSSSIRAVSWNLMSYGKSTAWTRQRQHELLRSLRPDVVCLQEIYAVDADEVKLGRLVREIAEAVEMAAFPVLARHSDCHLAILWRPEYNALSQRSYDLLMWHGLGIVRLDIGAGTPLVAAVTHLSPWNPDKQLDDTYTLVGKLPLSDAVLLGADWNSFGADPEYDQEPDWSALPSEWIPRHVRCDDDPSVPPVADRRPARLMRRSGFHDVASTLRVPWQATGGLRGGWRRREDVFWTTRPAALRGYQVIDTPAARAASDHLPIVVEVDPWALAERPSDAGRPA